MHRAEGSQKKEVNSSTAKRAAVSAHLIHIAALAEVEQDADAEELEEERVEKHLEQRAKPARRQHQEQHA